MAFKLKLKWTWQKWTMISTIFAFWLIFLILFIYTSWYQNDVALTKGFGEAGWFNPVINQISDYIVREGYFTLTTLAVPIGILLIEALLAYLMLVKKGNKTITGLWKYRRFYEVLAPLIWTGIMFVLGYKFFWRDQGFGPGFDQRSFSSPTFSIVSSVLILTFNIVLCWTMSWYVSFKIATRPDFLTSPIWRRAVHFALFTGLFYLVAVILKFGFQRPLYTQVFWGNQLEYLKQTNNEAWEYYMNQNQFHYGWHYGEPMYPFFVNNAWKNLPGEWPWWRVSQIGFFFTGANGIEGTFNGETAFPSGHLITGLALIMGIGVYTYGINQKTHMKLIRNVGLGFGIGYVVAMFLSLGFIYGHWISDMAFTLMVSPLIYFISWSLNKQLLNKAFVKINDKLQPALKESI